MASHEYKALSREERPGRIGALFYKAVMISLARKQAIKGENGEDVSAQTRENSPYGTNASEVGSLQDEEFDPSPAIVGLGTERLDREPWDHHGQHAVFSATSLSLVATSSRFVDEMAAFIRQLGHEPVPAQGDAFGLDFAITHPGTGQLGLERVMNFEKALYNG